MADYTGLTSVFEAAIPQVWNAKYPDSEGWRRTVAVSSEAEDNFLVTRTKVLISPKAIGENLDVFDFCVRICKATWDFDTRKTRAQAAIREEFQRRLDRNMQEIMKRWDQDTLAKMIDEAFTKTLATQNGKAHG